LIRRDWVLGSGLEKKLSWRVDVGECERKNVGWRDAPVRDARGAGFVVDVDCLDRLW
jgi:hypothetical protein